MSQPTSQPTASRYAVELLQRELARRCSQNARYSLRAFAGALGLSHSALSLVLSNKRRLSAKAAARVSDRLGLAPPEREKLLLSTALGRVGGEAENLRVLKQDELPLDQFELLSDPHHYAILSLFEIADTRCEPRWIARRLGISEAEARHSIALLERLKLLGKVGGRWKQLGNPIVVDNRVSTPATRKHHKKLLARAAESLENDPMETRDLSATTFAMDPADIPYARARIRAFREELARELETRSRPKEVYHLSVQIFPTSKGKK
ncbi:MAG TPA: DUF4423 domain-containing protein [Bdellovibrionota bacterium]|nr:DUF4423 domain-containing protein [Bdellovibrionota bacterium]